MAQKFLLAALLLAAACTLGTGLRCYQCGQYTEGVGSITPCINETYMKLGDCPKREHAYCIKYVSEGSVVKDCVAQCTEKEDWGSKTFCCTEDSCNGAAAARGVVLLVAAAGVGALQLLRWAH